jgi:hypothetical protein
VTNILQAFTFNSSFTLGFQMWSFDHDANDWTNQGDFTASMQWKTPPSSYPSGAHYLEGAVKNSNGVEVGSLTMGWVSEYLRKATIEIDRVSASENPANNGSGIDWRDVFDAVSWDVNAHESDTNLTAPSGDSWSDAELHQKMLQKRDSSNLDTEWRYHLLCVKRLDSTSRGIMYDANATDSNNVPREGAAISSHWVIPEEPKWGTVQGERFGAASAPYFRTAVHELGHAMGLRHNTADNGFMNTTGVIAGNSGTFPGNIKWAFNSEDSRKLKHMPDAWVRPGEIPWAPSYSAPMPADEAITDIEGLDFTVTALKDSVPIGAPVRICVELANNSDIDAEVPASLSLGSGFVSGEVIGPHGERRTFRSLLRCIEDEEHANLPAGKSTCHDLTLLRGFEGALFQAPGAYEVRVDLNWEIDDMPVCKRGVTTVMVTPPENEKHAAAALKVISEPDMLLTLVMGGDHMEKGVAALQSVLEDSVLAPHFAVVEAKRIGKKFGSRSADIQKALGLIDQHTVMSGSEVKRIAQLVQRTSKDSRKRGKTKSVISTLTKKVEELPTDESIVKIVKQL